MSLYRRKPINVEAVQFDPDAEYWPTGVYEIKSRWVTKQGVIRRFNFIGAPGSLGVCAIRHGDWVVRNQTGECYVVLQEYFLDLYEPIEGRP